MTDGEGTYTESTGNTGRQIRSRDMVTNGSGLTDIKEVSQVHPI